MSVIFNRTCLLPFFLLVLLVAPASAILVEVTDLDSPGGANNVTQDTLTGLEWLDWTASTNISFSSMITQFDLGDTYEGWRHATRAEVGVFLGDLGLPVNSWPSTSFKIDGGSAAATAVVLIGATGSPGSAALTGTESTSTTVFRTDISGGGVSVTGATLAILKTTPSGQVGHALVRSIASVPEPNAFLCFGLVGLGVSLLRNRNR